MFHTVVMAVVLFIAPLGASAQGVDTLPAVNVTATGATLRGQLWLLPDGGYAWFEWGETIGYGNMTAWTDVPPTADSVEMSDMLSGLKVNTRYHYRLVFEDWYGTVFCGQDETFTTSIFMEIGATDVTATRATLRGTVCANGVAVTAWFQWRDANGNGTDATNGPSLRISARTNGVPLKQLVTDLIPGHTYACDLWVTNGASTAHRSVAFTTPLLATVSTLAGSGLTSSNATLTGSANPTSLPSGSWFEWGTTTNYGNLTPPLDIGSGSASVPVSMGISQLSGLSDYHFRLVVSNAAGVVFGADNELSTPPGAEVVDGIYVTPTLIIPKKTPDPRQWPRVTATTTGSNKFYYTTAPPECRVRLTHDGQPIAAEMQLVSVAPTKLVLRFPPVDVGFYGFLIQASNKVTHAWENVYESGTQFFQVGEDALASVYHPFPRSNWTAPTNPKQFIGTTPCLVTGMITGVLRFPQRLEPFTPPGPPWDGSQFENSGTLHLGWTKNFPLDGEGEAGVALDFQFPMEGEVTLNYEIPFRLTLDFPTNVYAGQTLHLKARSFEFQAARLTAQHDLSFSTYHKLWLNAPYDLGFPALVNENLFKTNRLEVWGELPVAPGRTSSYGLYDSRDPILSHLPFASLFNDDGKITVGEILQEVYDVPAWLVDKVLDASVTLAGHTTYTNSGEWNGVGWSDLVVWTTGPQGGWQETPQLWNAHVDAIALLGCYNLTPVSQVALGFSYAGTELVPTFSVNVRSRDAIILTPPYLHDFTVYIPHFAGATYDITDTFTLRFDATFASHYLYKLLGDIYFDMPGIDRKNLASWDSDDFWTPLVYTNTSLTTTFTLNKPVTVSVMDKPTWVVQFLRAPGIPGADYDLISYPPAEADEERRCIANLSFKAPAPPPMVPSIILGTFPDKPESEMVLMLSQNTAPGGALTLDPPPVDGGYSNGTVVTVTAHAANGYQFAGWSGDTTGSNHSVTLTMNGVKNLTASFTGVTLTGARYATNGAFQFDVTGEAGQTCIVQRSTNLSAAVWSPIMTNTLPFTFTDTNAASYRQRLYRLLFLP